MSNVFAEYVAETLFADPDSPALDQLVAHTLENPMATDADRQRHLDLVTEAEQFDDKTREALRSVVIHTDIYRNGAVTPAAGSWTHRHGAKLVKHELAEKTVCTMRLGGGWSYGYKPTQKGKDMQAALDAAHAEAEETGR